MRPVLIIQNDMGNRYSPTVICAAITSQLHKAKLPTHVALDAHKYGIVKDSVILLEQVRTIDKSRLREKVCQFVTVYIRMKKSLQQKRHLWEEVSFLTPEGVKAYNRVGVESYKLSKC